MGTKIIIKRLVMIPAKCPAEMMEVLNGQTLKLEKLMATVQELAGRLNKVVEQLVKVKDEVATLRASFDNAGTLPPDAEAALGRLETITQGIDDINIDQPPVEPVPVAEEPTV